MARMGVDATTPGPREIEEWDLFNELVADGRIPVVSSNLYREVEGERIPLWQRHLILDVDGVRVGLFGLIGGTEFAGAAVPVESGVRFQDAEEAMEEMIEELRPQVDLVVMMAQMSSRTANDLLTRIPGVDVALYGNRPSFKPEAQWVGETLVNQTGSRGQYMGSVTVIVDPDGNVIDSGSFNKPLLDPIPKQPEMLARAEEADDISKELRRTGTVEADRQEQAALATVKYLGAETCRRCHAAEYDHWKTTPHAGAFATLSSDHGMERTPECTGCHVTGWEQTGGYVAGNNKPDLTNVQCEACHGPGTEHVRTGGSTPMAEATCTGCHSGEFAKDWDFGTYYELVRHDK